MEDVSHSEKTFLKNVGKNYWIPIQQPYSGWKF